LPPGIGNLRQFVRELNDEHRTDGAPEPPGGWIELRPEYQRTVMELRRLVDAWRASGPNVLKLFKTEHQLVGKELKLLGYIRPTKTAQARLILIDNSQLKDAQDPIANANRSFLHFLWNPMNERLGGPCLYCGKYFIKRTHTQARKYCTQVCGDRFTSRSANQKTREAKREHKLRLVRNAIHQWSTTKTKQEWKSWVAARFPVKKNWITRAVKSGDLDEPKTKAV